MKDDDDFLEEYDDDTDQSSGNAFMTFYQENKKLVWVLGAVILLIILMLLLSGGSNSGGNEEVTTTISSTSESVSVNNSVQLRLDVNVDKNPKVVWTSSNPNVATVDINGLVTGKSRGTTVITATYIDSSNKSYSQTCSITVYEGTIGIQLQSVSFKDGTVVMSPNSTYQLTFEKIPTNASVNSRS